MTPHKDKPQEQAERIKYAASLNLPRLRQVVPHDKPCMIVGSAPDVVDHVEDIEKRQDWTIFSVNGSYAWLLEQGIKPTHHVIFEYEVNSVLDALNSAPLPGVMYYTASHLKESVFDELAGCEKTLWHYKLGDGENNQLIRQLFPGDPIVDCPRVTLLATVFLAMLLGYQKFDFFGIAGSLGRDGSFYLPGYKTQGEEYAEMDVAAQDGQTRLMRHFKTTPALCHQTDLFFQFCQANRHLRMRMHGDGMLPFLHQTHFPGQYA